LDRHLSVVANGFRAAGCILGIPSIAAFVFVCWVWYSIQVTPPDPRFTSVQKYGIVGILESGAYGLGKVFQFFGGLSRWVAGLLALITMVTTLISVALFYTGRGLAYHAGWARVVGIILALGLMFVSSGGFMGLQRGASIASLGLVLAGGYAIWVLGWRFS